MDLYADNILDHYRAPRHKSPLPLGEDQGEGRVVHQEKNLSCGDTLTISLTIEENAINDIRWTGDGCAISQAAMSMMAEELIGKSTDDADAITPATIRALLGVPVGARRIKCALLCLHTLKNALHKFRSEPLQSWMETVGSEPKDS